MQSDIKDFPKAVYLTITNTCNLRCGMCGQWSPEGYMRGRKSTASYSGKEASFTDLKKIIDETAAHRAQIGIRGGEPLMYPRIIDLVTYIKSKGINLSVETNGVLLGKHAEAFVGLRVDHLTISVDGPEEIHDRVRGVKGTYKRLKENLRELEAREKKKGYRISRSFTFTINADNYMALGRMPDVARELGFGVICIVPYYFVPEAIGKKHEEFMKKNLSCKAYSWRGFHREESGVDIDVFLEQLKLYKSNLGDITSYPYMDFSSEEYREWFTKPYTTVHQDWCRNISGILDIQPDGSVDFCVDFPDYVLGNIAESSLQEIWNSDRAKKFRELRSSCEFPVCHRCGAKYMG